MREADLEVLNLDELVNVVVPDTSHSKNANELAFFRHVIIGRASSLAEDFVHYFLLYFHAQQDRIMLISCQIAITLSSLYSLSVKVEEKERLLTSYKKVSSSSCSLWFVLMFCHCRSTKSPKSHGCGSL